MKNRRKNTFTVGFYNVENLFDTVNNPNTADDDFTPNGKHRWNKKKYYQKIRKITSVISQIGKEQSNLPPVIVGLVEVENATVVKDLVRHKNLLKYNYDYVHFESNDERGIDVSLIYNRNFFIELSSKTYSLNLIDDDGSPDYTRDVLVVKGSLYNELVYIIVNHWPSRREGEEETKHKRIKAAELNQYIIEEIKKETENPKILIMGDFNDNPTSESIQDHLVSEELYNPMKELYKKGKGTLTYYKEWHLFDQIIISKNFFDSNSYHSFLKARVFAKDWLRSHRGKYKNSPFRTYIGPWHQGGYSDHFPVYLTFEKEE